MKDSHSPIRLLRKMSVPAAPSMISTQRTLRRASRLMSLEQRFMFDAAAVATAADAVQTHPDAHTLALIADVGAPTQVKEADPSHSNGRKEVVFVDTNVKGYKTLEADLPEGFAIVEIDGSRDGLAQMAKWAETHTGYDAIHILSHAVEGKLELGSALLTDSSLSNAQVQAEWAVVGQALNAGGDLMVYGCDLAKGMDGDLFIHDLAKATGADVAASTDLTGAASKDANWILEKQVGDIETRAFSVDGFNDTLGNVVTGNDPGASNTDTNTISTTSGLFDIGQSFTATKTGLLTTLTLYASFSNGGTATLNIYSGDGTGGALLGTQSLSPFNDAGTLDAGNNRYIGTNITLSTPLSITNGNVYTFQITTTDFISLTYTNQSNYAGGTLYQDGSDQGSSYDLEFSVTQADANSAPANSVAPAISGTQTVGNALSATTGTWSDPDSDSLTYSYQWYRADDSSGTNATAIGSATSSNYTLTTSDAHEYVRVVVTADDGNGHTPTANSAWTAVNDAAPTNSVVPALSGTATVGNALSTTTGTWSDADSDSLTYSYQWYRADDSSGTNATAIGSATSSSYTLTSSDGNHYVRAVVTANDNHGSSNQTAASSWTSVATVPSVSSVVRTGGASATVNGSASSVSYTVTFSESVTGVDASDFSLTETGTASGSIASVTGSGTTYTVTVDTLSGDGTMRLDLNGSGTGIKNGSSIDIAGGYTSGAAYTLDHTAPNAPSTPDMTSGTDTGSSNSDNITNNTTPDFSGTAEGGSTVTLYDTDGITVLGTTTAAGGGSWTITAATMSAGSHTVTAKATDAAGNLSSVSSGLNVTIDATAPAGLGLSDTTIASQNATSTSAIATLSATDSQSITYSLATGNGTNDADNGSFTISGNSLKVGASTLTAGTYKIYMAATDTAGNVANQAFTITIVDAPSVSSVVRTGGASATVNGSASSVSYTVTFSESVTGVDASDFSLTSTGTASGSIASVTGSGTTYTVTVDTLSGDGTMRLDLNGSSTGIKNGSSIDIAGGYTSGAAYTLDHTAPNAPSTPDMTSGTDTGSSNSDNITSNATPTFTGTAESGSTVTLYDTDGTTVLGSGTATGGNWSITSSTLSAGSHTLTAKATDAAGNTSSASSGLSATIDTSAPTVASVSVPSDGSYKSGQTLSFTVNTGEAVTIDTSGGTPRLALTVGGSTVYATYASGSGSTALVFTYTVQPGDTDSDGIAVGALQSNGGTLKDSAGNSMTLTLNSVGATTGVLVDTTAPTVASVGVPSNGTYYSNQNLDFTVNFSEAVTVDTSGGTPRIAMVVGSTTVYADYLSGSGTNALMFRYTVSGGLVDSNGVTVGALSANGGTLHDGAGNDATLTLNSVGSTASVNVDGTQARVLDVTSTTADGIYKTGDTVSITLTFSGAVTVDTTGGTPTLSLGDGGTANYASGSGSTALVFTYTVGSGQNTGDLDYASTGALALNGGTIKDTNGAHLDADLTLSTPGASGSLGANKSIVIDTTAPTITFGNLALSSDTGASNSDFITSTAAQTISATLSSAPAGTDIVYGSLDGGATWTDITAKVSGTTLTWNGVTLAGSSTLKLKVTDNAGNDGSTASHTYSLDTIAPAVPTATAQTSTSITPTLSGTASVDAGGSLTVAVGGATYSVVANNGSWNLDLASARPASGTLSLSIGQTYGVTVTVADAAGNLSTGSNVLNIVAAPIPIPAPAPAPDTSVDQSVVSTTISVTPPSPTNVVFLSPATASMLGTSIDTPNTTSNAISLTATPMSLDIVPTHGASRISDSTRESAQHTQFNLTQGSGESFRVVVVSTQQAGGEGLILDRGITDQLVPSSGKTEISIPVDAFGHTDSDAVIRLSAQQANGQPLPNWLRFDAQKGKFVVDAPKGVTGELAIKVVARDAQGHEVAAIFKIRVGAKNQGQISLDRSGRFGLSEQIRQAAAAHAGHATSHERLAELAHAARRLKT